MKPYMPLVATLALLGLAACDKSIKAPAEPGICFMAGVQKDGTTKFNPIAHDIKDIEHCALQLEIARRNFLRLGGGDRAITGGYNGSFIFLRREGIFTSTKLNGVQYPLLVRFKNELVMPGAIVEAPAPPAPK